MNKRKLSIKKSLIVILGFIFIIFSIFKFGNIMIKKIKYTMVESKKIVLHEEDKRYKVHIDPGHGGNDVGTISKNSDIYEKNLSFEISKAVVEKLCEYSNVDVIVSRYDDRYVSLEDRVNHANEVNADYFISIHLNADPNSTDTHGIETYYSDSNKKEIQGSSELAKSIQSNIIDSTGEKDRGFKKSNFMVTKFTKMPAVLIECGFLTNKNEKEKLLTQMYRDKLAQGIVNGLVDYIEQQ